MNNKAPYLKQLIKLRQKASDLDNDTCVYLADEIECIIASLETGTGNSYDDLILSLKRWKEALLRLYIHVEHTSANNDCIN